MNSDPTMDFGGLLLSIVKKPYLFCLLIWDFIHFWHKLFDILCKENQKTLSDDLSYIRTYYSSRNDISLKWKGYI